MSSAQAQHADTAHLFAGVDVGGTNIKLGIVEHYPAPYLVFDNDFTIERILETNDRFYPFSRFGPLPTTAVITYMPAGRHLLFA